jgi:hypothetical protein
MLQSANLSRIIISATLLLLIFAMGAALFKTGKPYNMIAFNIHKLTSLAFVVYFSYAIYNVLVSSQGSLLIYFSVALFIVSILALFVSGALVSQDKINDVMLLIHRISTGTFLISLVMIVLLLFKKQ